MKPQMTLDELDYIEGLLSGPVKTFVEFGGGGSTVYWAERLRWDQRLIVVEHDVAWANRIIEGIRGNPKVSLLWHPEDEGVIAHGYGIPDEENPVGLASYIQLAIDLSNSDMFLIDGVARGAVLATLRQFAAPSAIILLHDQPRGWTRWAENLYPKKELVAQTLMRLWL